MMLRQELRVLAWLGLWALAPAVQATDVSGEVTADTTWALAASPYNVTGSVRVTNGAKLTIEAGVQIFMAPGTGFTLEYGRLVALGTSNSRILITSVRDQVGSSPAAAPGDWQDFRIMYGRGIHASNLEFVTVRYGRGMLIDDAAPLLQSVALEYNAGPAISLDLESSPEGSGLTAIGNAVNGIAVPAGEMIRGARWALLGIPYVISGGILHVGARPAPLRLEPGHRYVEPGEDAEFLLSLAEPVAADTQISLSSSDTGVASVDPSVTVPAGAFSAAVTVHAVDGGEATITASNLAGDFASAGISVAPQPTLQTSQSPLVLSVSRTRDLYLYRTPGSTLASSVTVTLATEPGGIAQVPATIIIPAGQQGIHVPVMGASVGAASLTASAIGYIDSVSAITVEPLTMNWPTLVKVPIGTVTARLTFSDVVPPGGMTVAFASSDPARLTVPASLPVPAGATGLNVPLTGVDVGSATLTASSASYGQASIEAQVERLTAYFNLAARNIPAGFTEPFTVQLSNPAPQGGVTVTLTSSDAAIAYPLSGSVFIATGASSATVDVHALVEGEASITTGGSNIDSGSLLVTVGSPATLRFSQATNAVGRGLRSRSTRIQIRSGSAPFYPRRDVEISLSNPDSVALTVPASVLLHAGSDEAELVTVGNQVTASPISVNASAAEVQGTSSALEVSVVESVLAFVGLDNIRSPQSARDEFQFQWQVPGVPEQQVAATSQSIALSIVDASPSNIVDGFYQFSNSNDPITSTEISPGGWVSAPSHIAVPSGFGTYKVRAGIAGLGEWTSIEQSSVGLNLQFSVPSFISGKLLESRYVRIRRQLGGAAHAPNTSLSVNLTASDPTRVGTNSVIIPANASEVWLPIVGRELTANTLINATASGYASAPPLNVSVVEPTWEIEGLAGERALGMVRDQFRLAFEVPSSEDVYQSTRLLTAEVEVIDAVPAAVVPGIYLEFSGGAPVTSLYYRSGYGGLVGFVGEPVAAGSYAVRATVPGLANPKVSPTQTVTNNTLRFDEASINVGNGLRSTGTLRLMAPPTAPPLPIAVSCASANCSTPPTQELNWEWVEVPIVGVNFGSDVLTAVAGLPQYGSATLPVEIVPVTGALQFMPEGDECAGGWYLELSPGVANEDAEVTFAAVDQDPPGIFTESPVATIYAGESSTDSCFGIQFGTPASTGTYRVRATILGVVTVDSDLQTVDASLRAHPETLVAARGLDSRVVLNSTVAATEPAEFSASCVPANVCSPQSPVVIPASETSVEFMVQGTQNGNATLGINAPGYQGTSVNVEVRDPHLVVDAGQTNVQVGQNLAVQLRLYPQGAADWQIAFATSAVTLSLAGSAATAQIPPTVEIPGGEHLVEFNLTGLEPGDFTFTVNWPGVGTFESPVFVVTP